MSIRGIMESKALRQAAQALVVLYSLLVVASQVPGLESIPHTIVVPYFILVPGYCLSLFFSEAKGFGPRLSYSIIFSITLLLAVYALANESISTERFPYSVSLPLISIALSTYHYYAEGSKRS